MQDVIDRFAEQAPAALMFRSIFSRLFSNDVLDDIFSKHRGRQLESELLFSSLVRLLVPVVSGSSRSVNSSYQVSDLKVSSQAVYDKLKGIDGYHTFVIDGKTFNATEHRLKESRRDSRAPLPGRAVTILDTRSELFVDVESEPYAYRCERKIAESIMERLQEGALYLADRNFCDGPLLSSFVQAGAFFVVRQHGACPSWREISPLGLAKEKDQNGGQVAEHEVEVKFPNGPNGGWQSLRRVRVELKKPTRKGDHTLYLLTNLPPSVSAATIADSYRQRWTIETCFGYLSQALNAEINTLCYPAAASLCFCLALTLFNIMSTIKALLKSHGQPPKPPKNFELSYYYLAHEIAQCHAGMKVAIRDTYWHKYAKMEHQKFRQFLITIARNACLKRYRKHIRGPKKPRPKRKFDGSRHVATQKLLDARMTD